MRWTKLLEPEPRKYEHIEIRQAFGQWRVRSSASSHLAKTSCLGYLALAR